MTPQQIVGLAVRFFAIWLGLSTLSSIISLNKQLSAQPGMEFSLVFFLPWIFVLLVAVLLWFFPLTVANKLIPKTKFEGNLSVPAREAVTVACIVFSLWLFISYMLPNFSRYLTIIIFALKQEQPVTMYDEFHFRHLTPIVIEFVVVLLMMFKARRISAFLLLDKTPESGEASTDKTAG